MMQEASRHIYDWDTARPSPEAWAALQGASETDFPHTYGATAWHAAFRLLRLAKETPEEFATWDGWTSNDRISKATDDLDLTGFMFGYAINALRYMMELPPVADGATVVVGGGTTVRPMTDAPETELGKAMGGGA